MVHSDDMGLVLPPKVALTQVVIVPIVKKGDDEKELMKYCNEIFSAVKSAGLRVELDDRENYNPGFKFNHWEQRGVPVRLEVGARDLKAGEVRCCKRNDNSKMQLKKEGIEVRMKELLE
jgi:prolyl-tRNA synthetase